MKLLHSITPEPYIAVLGIVCVLGIEVIALLKGVDGTMFGVACATVGGIVGWVFKGYKVRK